MYYSTWEEWQKACPIADGAWDKERLYEYLVASGYKFSEQIEAFFMGYRDDEALADLLFSFLLDEDYDGSDSQMGAARVISAIRWSVFRAG